MLDSKKVIIGTLATVATAIVVDTTICIVKGRDWFAITSLIKKMIISIGSGVLSESENDQLVNEAMEIVEKINIFIADKNVRKLSKEDRNELHLLREELEHFYNAHCA